MTAAGTQSALTPEMLQGLFSAAKSGVEQLPALRQALEDAASACAEEMRNLAGTPVRLVLEKIETGTLEQALTADSAAVVIEASGWETQLLAWADKAATFLIVEMLLGSDGTQPVYEADRSPTGIEVEMVGFFFGMMAKGLAASFAPIAATPFGVGAKGDEIDADTFAPETPMAFARYRLDAGERGGTMCAAFPASVLETLRKPLTAASSAAAPKSDPDWAQQIRKEVTRANVTLTAILEERPGILSEVFSLRVGQLIELNATPQSRVRVECNGEPLAWCDLGKSNGTYTLRIDSFVNREQEFLDDILAA